MTAPPTPAARISGTSSLKIHPIPLDKDAWENVPGLVYKSFHLFNTNMGLVKKWADRHEERSKQMLEQHHQTESRMDKLDASFRVMQERLEEMSGDIKTMSDSNQQRAEMVASCIGTLFLTTRALFTNLGHAFGFDLAGSSEEEAALEGLRGGEDNMEVLRMLGSSLEARLDMLRSTFDRWSSWRAERERRQEEMQETIRDLSAAAERTRERLLTWREMLKESSHAIGSLGTSLAATQGAVQELQATQVQRHDVEEAVSRRAQQVEALVEQTELRVDGLADRLEMQTEEVQKLIQDVRHETEEQIEAHSSQVSQMLERNLNPVNAYLNTMHVKSDVVRVELNSLNDRVPKLATSIEEVAAELRRCDEAGFSRSAELGSRLDRLVLSVAEWGEKGNMQHTQLSGTIDGLEQDLMKQLDSVRASLGSTAEVLDNTRQGEIATLSRDLVTLEQKVAKWVHAHPLPAKISEARLFSIEARLAEETDARLLLEQCVKPGRSPSTPRQAVALPLLSQHMRTREEGQRSSRQPSSRMLGQPG